jgi:hypothetical protein
MICSGEGGCQIEQKTLFLCPSANYMTKQKDLNDKMREILIDWLMQVQTHIKLKEITLHLTVNIIDRFLSLRGIDRKKLQLVGCTSLIIALKYEETVRCKMENFVYLCSNAYTREEFLAMESIILKTLNFQISYSNSSNNNNNTTLYLLDFYKNHLIEYITNITTNKQREGGEEDVKEKKNITTFADETMIKFIETESLSLYLINISLLEYCCLKYSSSLITTSSLYLSISYYYYQKIEKEKERDEILKILQLITNYNYSEMKDCMGDLINFVLRIGNTNYKNKGVYKKFMSPKFHQISEKIDFDQMKLISLC